MDRETLESIATLAKILLSSSFSASNELKVINLNPPPEKISRMSIINAFKQLGNYSKQRPVKATTQAAVIYTRVSSKEQADHNLSLYVQRKLIEDFARRSAT